jgi:hypothetical protein
MGISIGKLHTLTGKLLHGRRLIDFVETSLLFPEWHRGILPAHIIYQKDNDVWLLIISKKREADT